jgi:hypothetical protein
MNKKNSEKWTNAFMKWTTEEAVEGMESWVFVYRVFLTQKIYTTRKDRRRKEC